MCVDIAICCTGKAVRETGKAVLREPQDGEKN